MQKRGQFYLIAAIIIIGVIAGLAQTYNVASAPKPNVEILSLAEEINFEGSQILENGAIHSLAEQTVKDRIEILAEHYSTNNPTISFIFIYGASDITFYLYNPTATLEIYYNNLRVEFQTPNIKTLPRTNSPVLIKITDEISRSINAPPGQFFFAVLVKEQQDERFIVAPNLDS